MLENTDIYPPQPISGTPALIAFSCCLLVVIGTLLYRYLRKRLALRRQRKLLNASVANAADIVQEALRRIAEIRGRLQSAGLPAAEAAELLSAIMRETVDALKNHRTRYQSRSEISRRNLDRLAPAVERAYPPEFSHDAVAVEDVLALCDEAEQVVQSCL